MAESSAILLITPLAGPLWPIGRFVANVGRLSVGSPYWRLRVGGYRAICAIEKDGRPTHAVEPIDLYHRLLAPAEDAEDIQAANDALDELATGQDELVPAAVAHRRLLGCLDEESNK